LVHEIRFLHPVFVGDLLMFKGEVVGAGTTSVTVRIIVDVERIDTREVLRVTEARIVYVAVDRERGKVPLVTRRGEPAADPDDGGAGGED
jgi:acyl-CoA hydrolase